MTINTTATPGTSPELVDGANLPDFVRALVEQNAAKIVIEDDRGNTGYWLVNWETPA